ncbi:MAG: hypothetical protein WC674_01400 [Candidatus Krumholzibacteriia bacterium]
MGSFARNTRIVLSKEFKEQRRRRSQLLMLVMMLFLWMYNIRLISKTFQRLGYSGAASMLIGNLFTHQVMSCSIIVSFAGLASLFYKEKHSRTLENLLTTAMTPKAVWIGKSLFMYLIGLTFSYVAAAIGLVLLNVSLGGGTRFILPNEPALVFFFVIFPVLFFLLCSLMSLIHLISGSGYVGNMIYLLIGIGYLGMSSARMKSMLVSWNTICYYAAFLGLLLCLVVLLSRLLTKERMIMTET